MRIRSTLQEYHLLMLVVCQISLDFAASDNIFVGLNTDVYTLEGDINLGALYSITEYSLDPNKPGCSKTPRALIRVLENIEATMYAVKKINDDETILPNITLGMYIVDYCILSNMALAKSLSFLPGREDDSIINKASTNHYDVVGVVGLSSSDDAIPVSCLYSSAQLPLLSFMATSDYLSNKDFHSYFLRVVPSDVHRVLAMLQFIYDNGWSFISVVYDEGEYGEAAFYTVKRKADDFGVCLAASLKISSKTNFDYVIEKLLRYRKARIVILFTNQKYTYRILETASQRTPAGHFIWIGSEGLEKIVNIKKEISSHVQGSFNFKHQSFKCPEFTEYFNKLLPSSTSNPWLPKFFEIFGKCSLENKTCNLSKSAGEFSGSYSSFTTSLVMDSIATYADAIHRLLRNLCPNALGKEARNCIKRDVLRQYLLNASFKGVTGRIQFDEDGNLNGMYEIEQFVVPSTNSEFISDEQLIGKTIAFYDIIAGTIEYLGNNISWKYFSDNADDMAPSAGTTNIPPDSSCSRPCSAGEYPVPKEIICCWECRKCRQNEIVVNNGTHCEPCQTLFWPDQDSNFTTCSPISATFTSFSDYVAQIEICVAVLAVVFQVYVSIVYVNVRDSSIIKASDRELSAIQMVGIFLGYLNVILFQAKPAVKTCSAIYLMFCFSFSFIYAPLLVKTVRLYRIFQSQAMSLSSPLVISTKSQIMFACMLILPQLTANDGTFPGLNSEYFALEGDINIGALYSITEYSIEEGIVRCSKKLRPEDWIMENIEATMFTVNRINSDPTMLPNVSLGVYIVDYCASVNTALAKSLSFLPVGANPNNSVINTKSKHHFDVVGVVGLYSSDAAKIVSYLYSAAQLPIISFLATSDYLSNKDFHSYFLRVVPSDVHRVLAMLQFISDNGWSFISVVYDEGAYGEGAFYTIKQNAEKFGICLASTPKISSKTNFDRAIQELLLYRKARVIVGFLSVGSFLKLLTAAKKLSNVGHFIWIGSDGFDDVIRDNDHLFDQFLGSFLFVYESFAIEEFTEYYDKLLVNSSTNPWLTQYFEILGQCSFKSGTCNATKSAKEFPGYKPSYKISIIMDSILTYAHAIDRLLRNLCPNALGKAAQNCIKRDVLRQYLLNTSFNGPSGHIQFDEDGNLNGKIEIVQFVSTKEEDGDSLKKIIKGEVVAIYDVLSSRVVYALKNISWKYFSDNADDMASAAGTTNIPPDSSCSRPCSAGEYPVPKEIICCWDCRKCRQNEIVVNNGTHCEPCQTLFWPDQDSNFTTCSPISATFTSFSDLRSQVSICLACCGLALHVFITASYIVYHNTRIIKASGRELIALQLFGIFLGYVTVILFHAKPTFIICHAIYLMFCLSFAWLYAPLLVKTIRIHRIFKSKRQRRMSYVSPKSQVLLAITLVLLQTFICLCVNFLQSPTPTLKQPVATQKLVELYCHVHIAGIFSFLSYNVILVFLCSIFAFKTRSLPENFSESKFISMCVFTTLVIWLSFICAYVSTSQEQMKVVLLCVALLLNHTVALLFLFLPKIYAAVYIVEPSMASRPSMFIYTKPGQNGTRLPSVSATHSSTER